MTIHLVRHGQTAHNREGQGLGHADVGLTELGVAQAEAVALRMAAEPVQRVLASPLERANFVARSIAAHHGLEAERAGADRVGRWDTEGLEIARRASATRFHEDLGDG